MMQFSFAASLLFALMTLAVIQTTAPPAYETLIGLILSGESEDFSRSQKRIDEIAGKNPTLAREFRAVFDVFKTRHLLTAGGNHKPKAGTVRILVRALEDTNDPNWDSHPLRLHALGEAYSLYADIFTDNQSLLEMVDISEQSLVKKAIDAYEQVVLSNSPLATAMLKASAMNNVGNVYIRHGEVDKALSAWRDANDQSKGYRNISTWGNIVGGLAMKGDFKSAIAEGEVAQKWAEQTGAALQDTNRYAGILTNMGIARLITNDLKEAAKDLTFVAVLLNDDLANMNASLALALINHKKEAVTLISHVAADPIEANQIVAAKGLFAPLCTYLLWDIADPEAEPWRSASRLETFLGRPIYGDEITTFTPKRVKQLRMEALEKLKSSHDGCSVFSLVPGVIAHLRGQGIQLQ